VRVDGNRSSERLRLWGLVGRDRSGCVRILPSYLRDLNAIRAAIDYARENLRDMDSEPFWCDGEFSMQANIVLDRDHYDHGMPLMLITAPQYCEIFLLHYRDVVSGLTPIPPTPLSIRWTVRSLRLVEYVVGDIRLPRNSATAGGTKFLIRDHRDRIVRKHLIRDLKHAMARAAAANPDSQRARHADRITTQCLFSNLRTSAHGSRQPWS
jgi:hypothetical protein